MIQGIVKFFNQEKGFGFLTYDGNKEIFVHQSAVEGKLSLNEGDAVSFEIGDGRQGPMAVNVILEGSSALQSISEEDDME